MQNEPMPVQPSRTPPPPLPRKPARAGLWVTVSLLLVFGLAGVAVFIEKQLKPAPLPPRPQQSGEARRAEILEAIAAPVTESDSARVLGIRESLLGFGKAILSRDTAGKAYLDVPRMVREFERLPDWPKFTPRDRADLAKGFERGVDQWFGGSNAMVGYDEVQIRSIRPVADQPGEMVVYARFKVDGMWVTFRYWMIKTDRWRIYDFEDLNVGMRISTIMSRIMASVQLGDMRKLQEVKDQGAVIRNAMNGLSNGLYEETVRITDGLQRSTLPDEFYAVGLVARGGSQLWLGRSAEAMKTLREAEQLNPDSPLTMVYLAEALLQAGKYEEGLVYARRYRENLGPTALGNEKIGRALNRLDRPVEALAAIEEGLDDEGDSVDLLHAITLIDTPEARAAFAKRITACELPAASVRTLLTELDRVANIDAMDQTLRAHRSAIADTIDDRFFTAALHEHRQEYAQAAEKFASDLRTTDPHFAKAVVGRYLWSMASNKKAMEGYKAAPDQRTALKVLVDQVRPGNDVLAPIVDLHLANDPTDAVAWKALGSILVEQDRFDAAVGAFDNALKHNTDPDATDNIHWRRLHALHRIGKSVDTFVKEYPWSVERFHQLAPRLRMDRDVDGLARVIDAHRKAKPDSPRLREWDGNLAYTRKEWEKAIEIFKSIPEDSDDDGLEWRRRDAIVRSLYHLGRFDEARRYGGDKMDPLQSVLLDCAQGLNDSAINRIKSALDDDYAAEEFLDDPELVEVLKDKRVARVKAYLDTRHAQEKAAATAPSNTD